MALQHERWIHLVLGPVGWTCLKFLAISDVKFCWPSGPQTFFTQGYLGILEETKCPARTNIWRLCFPPAGTFIGRREIYAKWIQMGPYQNPPNQIRSLMLILKICENTLESACYVGSFYCRCLCCQIIFASVGYPSIKSLLWWNCSYSMIEHAWWNYIYVFQEHVQKRFSWLLDPPCLLLKAEKKLHNAAESESKCDWGTYNGPCSQQYTSGAKWSKGL